MKREQRFTGFTIVELLIVIVVIGILAAVSVVAYNGIQQRSYNAKAVSAVDAYIKILKMYKSEKGVWPTTVSGTQTEYACLTPAGSLPADSNFSANVCAFSYGTPTSINPTFNALLTPYANPLPNGTLPTYILRPGDSSEYRLRGLRYTVFNSNSENEVYLIYAIKGNQTCSRGQKIDINDINGNYTGDTMCEVYLPH